VTPPTLLEAVRSLNAKKAAAGATEPVYGPRLSAAPAVLAGTDLDPEELVEFCDLNARRGMALVLAHGPLNTCATLWCDGLFVGLEFARMRDQEEGLAARNRALAGALAAVKRILEESSELEASRRRAVIRSRNVIDVVLEGEAEDA
jgi:hypothetical protein